MNLLQKSILSTIVYYDTLDYPLTSFEVFKYLLKCVELSSTHKISLVDIRKNLESGDLKKFIEEKNGFYFLKGRKFLIRQRIERQKIAISRWKKVSKVIKFLQICPFVEMIAVCNSLAIDNSKEKADIDFFIIVSKKRIWLTRFLVTLIVSLLGQRRHGQKIASRICLSFYITDQALDLEPLTLVPHDIHLAYWTLELKPVYWRNYIYEDFISANQWLKDYFWNFPPLLNKKQFCFKKNRFLYFVQSFLEEILRGRMGDLTEKALKLFQKYRISHKLTFHKIPTAVVISDKVLKFHENDRRNFFQEKFKKKLKILFNHNFRE